MNTNPAVEIPADWTDLSTISPFVIGSESIIQNVGIAGDVIQIAQSDTQSADTLIGYKLDQLNSFYRIASGAGRIWVRYTRNDRGDINSRVGQLQININTFVTPYTDTGTTNGVGRGIPLDAWGAQKVVSDYSLLTGMFTYEVPQEYWYEQINGVEQTSFTNATSVNGLLNLVSNGVLNDDVCLRTFRNPRYQPNRGYRYAGSLLFPDPHLRGRRRWGTFTREAGIFFELVGDGVDYTLALVSRTTINSVTSDTVTFLQNTPATLDPVKGNIYDIQAQMRMVGNFKAFIGDEATGASLEAVTVENINKLDNLSIFNPAMPIAFECTNQGDDVTICCGCVDISSEGGKIDYGIYGSVGISNESGQVGISGFNVPVLAVRNLSTVPNLNLINTRDMVALLATAYADQRAVFRVWATRDQTAIAVNDQTWQPFRDGLIEFIEYDNPNVTTPMTFDTTKATLIFTARVDQDNSYSTSALFEGRTDIPQTPGDVFIFTMSRETGGQSNVGVTYEFAELV